MTQDQATAMLDATQIQAFRDQGFLTLESFFTRAEVGALRRAADEIEGLLEETPEWRKSSA